MFCVLHLTFLLFSDTHAALSGDPSLSLRLFFSFFEQITVFNHPVPALHILNGFICPEIKAHLPFGYDL